MDKFKETLLSIEAPRILDIGTGGGNFIRMITSLTDHYSKIVGIDTNERAIDACKKNFDDARITFEKMDVEFMTYEKHAFDIVCLSNSMHHLDDLDKKIEAMFDMLKPDGILIFNEMHQDFNDEKQLTHTQMHHFWAEIDRIQGVVHHETMTKHEILKTFEPYKILDSWQLEFPQQDLSEDDYKWLANSLTQSLERVKDHDRYEDFSRKADLLKKRLTTVGFASAPQLMVVVKK